MPTNLTIDRPHRRPPKRVDLAAQSPRSASPGDESTAVAGTARRLSDGESGTTPAASAARRSPRVSPAADSSPPPGLGRSLLQWIKRHATPLRSHTAVDQLDFAGALWIPRYNAPAWDALAEAKASAAHTVRGCATLTIAGHEATVYSAGKGGGTSRFPYRVTFLDGSLVVFLAPRNRNDRSARPAPNVKVEIKGTACTLLGARESLRLARGLLEHFGFEWNAHQLYPTRVDVAHDIAGLTLEQIARATNGGRRVLATAVETYRATGPADALRQISCGRSDRARVSFYPKGRQVEQKADASSDGAAYAAAYWERWEGEVIDDLLRVELQVGREVLRSVGLGTLAQLLGNLPHLVHVLTRDKHPFFRITARNVDRGNNNQGRAGVSSLWAYIARSFRQWEGWEDQPAVPPAEKVAERVNPLREVRTSGSLAVKSLVALGRYVPNVCPIRQASELFREIADAGGDAAADLRQRLGDRQRIYAARLCREPVPG